MRPFTGETYLAVVVRHANGRANYFLTLGKFWWQAELADIATAVLRRAKGYALDGEPTSAEVCYSLQDASGEPYFFEHLLALSRIPLPDYARLTSDEAEPQARAIYEQICDGEHVYYCGSRTAYDLHRRPPHPARPGSPPGPPSE